MGLFNFLFKGMGFEDDKSTAKKPKKKSNIIQADDLVEKTKPVITSNIKIAAPSTFSNNYNSMEMGNTNLLVHVPKNNKDIQLIVDTLRRRESAIVNLGALTPNEAEKIIDFLSGAVYALKGNLRRLEGDLFLLTPEGINVVSPDPQ